MSTKDIQKPPSTSRLSGFESGAFGFEYFLGIDGGGSKCKALLCDASGYVLAEGLGGPANPFYGVERTLKSIVDATEQALENASLPPQYIKKLVVGMGLAGANLPELYQEVVNWTHPFAELFLTTDVDIANLGAHNGEDGAVIVVGTGSCGYSNIQNTKQMIGGHGFPIGDIASGAWMGLKAIEYTLLAMDGFEPNSLLAEKISEFYQVSKPLELSEKLIGKASSDYAKVAKVVFDCAAKDDGIATAIINEGLEYIRGMSKKLIANEDDRLCLIGGLAQFYRPLFDRQLENRFAKVNAGPEVGAIMYSLKQLACRNPLNNDSHKVRMA